jgi:hypothetical protein
MIIRIDIDETICITPDDRDYSKSTPIPGNIEKANRLFDADNTIIYWTSRGYTTGIDWSEITTGQLHRWGVKYHKLEFGKPHYDLFIDDKVMNTKDWK